MPAEFQYRVMYKHPDGLNVCFAGPFEDADRAFDVKAMQRASDPLARDWWVEKRPIGAWERVS